MWEVKEKGVFLIQSNITRHIATHLPSSLPEDMSKSSKGATGKESPTQYEFVVHWLASGLPHYQVTRNRESGLYMFLKTNTTCPVSAQNTFNKHRDVFLEHTVSNMQAAMKGKLGFILGDSSPDRMKREWISFGVTFIDIPTLTFSYMPLGLYQAKGRLTEHAYESHHVDRGS